MIEIDPGEMFRSTNPDAKFGSLTQAQTAILDECNRIATFLIEKNKAYGNSALEPVRIMSKADPVEQIKVRIDDKLSRLARGNEYPGDNDIDDLIGYLVLLIIAKKGAWK